jgi:anti-anti-sigma regulatory factor
LLLKQEGGSVFSLDLSTRHGDGHGIVMLRGELDVVDAAGTAGALAAVTAREPRVIIDLAALEFIDSQRPGSPRACAETRPARRG